MPESSPGFIFVTSLLVAFSGALIPGPMLALNISESAQHGFRSGPLLIVGHAIAEGLLLLALVLGLSTVVRLPWLNGSVSLVGGVFLLWMAFGIIRQGRKKEIFLSRGAASARHQHRTVVAGLLLSVLNPTWLLWWATIGATFVVWSMNQGPLGPVYFYFGHILADFTWYSFVSFVVAGGRQFFSHSAYRWLLLGSGFFLLVLGGYFVFKGATFWLGASPL